MDRAGTLSFIAFIKAVRGEEGTASGEPFPESTLERLWLCEPEAVEGSGVCWEGLLRREEDFSVGMALAFIDGGGVDETETVEPWSSLEAFFWADLLVTNEGTEKDIPAYRRNKSQIMVLAKTLFHKEIQQITYVKQIWNILQFWIKQRKGVRL